MTAIITPAKLKASIRSRHWQTTVALTAVAAVYGWLAFVFLPAGAYWNPDTGYRRLMAHSVRFDPLPDFAVDYPGRWLDPTFRFVPALPHFFFVRGDYWYITQPASIALLSKPSTPVRRALQLVALGVLAMGVWTFKPANQLHGVLSVSPFLVLGLTPSCESERVTRSAHELLFILLGFFTLAMLGLGLFTSKGPSTGTEWGARYFLPVFPLGVPLALAALQGLRGRSRQSWLARVHLGVGVLLIGPSAYLLIPGVMQMHNALTHMALRGAAVLALPEKHIVSDFWQLPIETPAVYEAKEVFFVDSTEQSAAWIEAAQAHGVERFVYVSQKPMTRARLKTTLPAGTRGTVLEDRVLREGLHLIRIQLEPLP